MNNQIIKILNLFHIEICKLKNLVHESISQEQIEEFKHLFEMYDKNGCCFISKQDFKTILSTRSFDLKPSDYEIDLLV
jgi:Ca2+-binding EF-hand superfamily protein